MDINLKQELLGLDKEVLKDDEQKSVTAGLALAKICGSVFEGDRMKMFILATKFYDNETITLDKADLEQVKNAVKNTKIYSAIVSGQLEVILSEPKK